MSTIPIPLPNTCDNDPPQVKRRVYLEDFFENEDDCTSDKNKNKYNKYSSYNNDTISKNQQEFGHRKRIKP